MNIDDLKDQLKESIEESKRQIEESPVYILGKEKYDMLDPKVQKGILIGVPVLFALILLMIPLSYYSSASENMDSFAENRQLIKEVMRVDRELKSGPRAPSPLPSSQLKSLVDRVINSSALLPEQMGGSNNTIPNIATKISKVFDANAVRVSVNKLNLRQVADIGFNLQNIADSVKMTNLEIFANTEDDHYFDVTYELSVFSIPVAPPKPEKNTKKKGRGRNK